MSASFIDTALRAVETDIVLRALAETGGNVRAAAKLLGLPRRTLDRRIVALGLRERVTAAYPRAGRQPRR